MTTPRSLGAGALAWTALAFAASMLSAQTHAVDRIYAEVRTAAGQNFEGFLRWDRNEVGWYDVLDGTRDLDQALVALAQGWEDEAEGRARSVEFLGVRISWNEEPDGPSAAEAGIRFGHVASLLVTGDDRARLRLKSGEEVELFGGSTDLGTDMRELVIEDRERGPVELRWRDLDRITFREAPAGVEPEGRRIYGVVENRSGQTFEGPLAWDLDEVLTTDVLDGRSGRTEHEIAFAEITEIERLDGATARVRLADGRELELGGTNDVASGHRGVQVSDPALGQVNLPWREVRTVRFVTPPQGGAGYDAFDGGHRLRGTVDTEDGTSLTGTVIWDADEQWSWEMINGTWRGIEFDIEFGQVAEIRKVGRRSAEITLRDGRTFELEGSNDVNRSNKGILVEVEGGDAVVVDWDRFRRLTLDPR